MKLMKVIGEIKKMNGLNMLKTMFYVLFAVMLDFGKAVEDITGFSMKDCLSLRGLGWKYLSSLRTEEDEPIYKYNDKYMRYFVSQSIKERRVCRFNQYFK